MAGMVARDAAVQPGAVANADLEAAAVEKMPRGSMCVVFTCGDHPARTNYLGTLTSEQLTLSPDAKLSALVDSQPTDAIIDTQPIPEVLKRLRSAQSDSLPVFDPRGGFVGIISQSSILEALLRRERQLLKKTREFRQTSQDDKERRYETTRRLEQTNLAFRKLLTALARPESLETYRQALEALAVVANAGWAQLALCDESGAVIQRVLASHPSAESFPPNYLAEQQMQQVITGNALMNRPGTAPAGDGDGSGGSQRKPQPAFLGLPLSLDDRRFGCVYLWVKLDARAFVDDDEVLLSSLGHSISLTIAQAIDHKRRKRLEKELDLLARTAREAGGADNVESVARIVMNRTEDYWDWDAFAVCISRCHGRKFQAVLELDRAAVGTPPGGETWSEVYDNNEPAKADGENTSTSPQVNRRIMSGEPILINRQDLDKVVMMQPFGDSDRPSASLMYVPIHGRNRVVGLITVQSYQRNRFKSRDLALLQRLADSVAPAFCRCLAERTTQAFYDLSSKLSVASTPKEAASIIMNVADELIGWDSCAMYFYYPESDTNSRILLMDVIEGRRVDLTNDGSISKPGGISRRALTEGPILYLRPEARFDTAQCEPFGDVVRPSASLMYVPLKYKDRVLGVMSVQSYSINAYDEDDLALLMALGDQCSGAIDRIKD